MNECQEVVGSRGSLHLGPARIFVALATASSRDATKMIGATVGATASTRRRQVRFRSKADPLVGSNGAKCQELPRASAATYVR